MAKNGDTDLVSTDTNAISELASQLRVASNRLETQITSIYKTIDSMECCWSGESYETFVSKCNDARPSLEALVLFVKAYSELLNSTVKDAGEKYIEDAASALGGK